MPQEPADRRQLAELEVMTHARLIAGGLAGLGMTRDDVVAVLLHHDPVYLSVIHACRIAQCRLRHISPHATREQILSTLAEPGIRALFAHEYFLPALARPMEDIAVIAVTPLSLFPGASAAALGLRHCRPSHQWLPLQQERDAPLGGRGPRRSRRDSAALGAVAVGDCVRMLSGITAGAADRLPPADGA